MSVLLLFFSPLHISRCLSLSVFLCLVARLYICQYSSFNRELVSVEECDVLVLMYVHLTHTPSAYIVHNVSTYVCTYICMYDIIEAYTLNRDVNEALKAETPETEPRRRVWDVRLVDGTRRRLKGEIIWINVFSAQQLLRAEQLHRCTKHRPRLPGTPCLFPYRQFMAMVALVILHSFTYVALLSEVCSESFPW